MPDVPSPAIARPTINILEDCAAPQMSDPSSKTPIKVMNVYLGDVRQTHRYSKKNYLADELIVELSCQGLKRTTRKLLVAEIWRRELGESEPRKQVRTAIPSNILH